MIKVSVIVATYNQSNLLGQCLESLLKQSMPRDSYEVIVVDDGSSDGTPGVIASYRRQVQAVRLQQNQGLANACNAGLSVATGQYIIRVDSDDWAAPEALQAQCSVLEGAPEVAIVLPDYWRITGDNLERRAPELDNVYSWLAGGCLIRKSSLDAAGGYRPVFWEEYDLYLRMLERNAVATRLALPLLYYRAHLESMTAKEQARMSGWDELLRLWPLGTLRRWGHSEELDRAIAEGSRAGE